MNNVSNFSDPTPYTEGCAPNAVCATNPNSPINYQVVYGAVTLGALSVTALAIAGIGYYCYKRWFKPVSPTIAPPLTTYKIDTAALTSPNTEKLLEQIEREKRILVNPWGYPEKSVFMKPKHTI